MYDFDRVIPRRDTGSYKWDFMPPGAEEAVPMWIADMDFAAPPQVTQALIRQAESGVYGYTLMTRADLAAARDWCRLRHGQDVPQEWLLPTPGVVYAMRAALFALTRPGDAVIVQPPVHTPFFVSASRFDRRALTNPLIEGADGRWRMDLEGLEACFRGGAKVLLMCSPHNPVGRVWTREELEALADLVKRYDAYVIADEIHRDILLYGNRHIPLATLPGMEKRVVTLFSTSKTFNLGGFHIATAIIADDGLREATRQRLYDIGHCCGRPTMMSIAAQTAAYREGGAWLDELCTYLEGNMDLALRALQGLPVSAFRPEATYMFYMNCEKLGLDAEALMDLMVREAGVLPEPGHIYESLDAPSGVEKHLRFNVAMPRAQLATAMERVRRAILSRA